MYQQQMQYYITTTDEHKVANDKEDGTMDDHDCENVYSESEQQKHSQIYTRKTQTQKQQQHLKGPS